MRSVIVYVLLTHAVAISNQTLKLFHLKLACNQVLDDPLLQRKRVHPYAKEGIALQLVELALCGDTEC